ncbi:MAG: VCBS repeat-containing protein [Planctomycetota bacterium]
MRSLRSTLVLLAAALTATGPAHAQTSFATPVQVSEAITGRFTTEPIPADIDGNGIPDLIVNGGRTSETPSLYVARGLGGRTFTAAVRVPLSHEMPQRPAAADLDGDGDDDLAGGFVGVNDRLVLLLSNGGNFTEVLGPVQPGELGGFALEDADLDGDLDLYFVVQDSGWRVRVAELEGGSFTGQVTGNVLLPTMPSSPPAIEALDLDGDGRGDVHRWGRAALRTANGFGALLDFQPPTTNLFSDVPIFVDLDLDGLPDYLAVSALDSPQTYPNSVFLGEGEIFLGGGAIGFAEVLLVDDPSGALSFEALADMDGDGLLDVVYAVNGARRISFGDGTLPFDAGSPFDFAGAPFFRFADQLRRDYNGDGSADFITGAFGPVETQVAWGSPTGLTPLETLIEFPGVSAPLRAVQSLDFDGDGDLDVLGLGVPGQLFLVENLGGHEFADAREIGPTFAASSGLGRGDFDGDGSPEIAVSGNDEGRLFVFEIVAGANVQLSADVAQPVPGLVPQFAEDLDGDGDDELVLGSGGATRVFAGGPGGLDPNPTQIGALTRETSAADLDGDGDLDLVNRSLASVFVVENLGGLSFGAPLQISWGPSPPGGDVTAVAALDHDGDGVQDLLARTETGLLRRRGLGSFGAYQPVESLVPSGLPEPARSGRPLVADVDLDGDEDLVLTVPGAIPGRAEVFFGPAVGGQVPRLEFGGLRPEPAFIASDLDGDGDLDLMDLSPEGEVLLLENDLIPRSGVVTCTPPNANSSGVVGRLDVYGEALASGSEIQLRTSGLPPSVFGIFIGAPMFQPPVALPGSDGALCLAGPLGRYQRPGEILSSGPGGSFALSVGSDDLRSGGGVVPATAFLQWSFQAWHRDVGAGGSTSNTTEAVTLTFL